MSIATEAQSMAKEALADSAYEAEIRAEYATLRSERLKGKGGLDITSGTVNGQSFSGSVNMTKGQRLQLLRRALAQVDAGGVIPNRTRISF